MLSVNEIAEKFGVKPVVAYGLVSFLSRVGVVETTKAKLPVGQKGKAPTLYNLDKACADRLATLFVEKLGIFPNNEPVAPAAFAKSCEIPSAECFSGGCG